MAYLFVVHVFRGNSAERTALATRRVYTKSPSSTWATGSDCHHYSKYCDYYNGRGAASGEDDMCLVAAFLLDDIIPFGTLDKFGAHNCQRGGAGFILSRSRSHSALSETSQHTLIFQYNTRQRSVSHIWMNGCSS